MMAPAMEKVRPYAVRIDEHGNTFCGRCGDMVMWTTEETTWPELSAALDAHDAGRHAVA